MSKLIVALALFLSFNVPGLFLAAFSNPAVAQESPEPAPKPESPGPSQENPEPAPKPDKPDPQ